MEPLNYFCFFNNIEVSDAAAKRKAIETFAKEHADEIAAGSIDNQSNPFVWHTMFPSETK